jgi:endonuclease/exonuclease/phosphatase family metal-dependent hydrolase
MVGDSRSCFPHNVKGGTAVLTKDKSTKIKLSDNSRSTIENALGGRLTAVGVEITGHKTWLASIYLNATPDKRTATLLVELDTADPPLLAPNTITGGDFNCVAAPSLDIRHKTPQLVPSYYSNEHHQKWDTYAAGLGLTDTYRLPHGDLKGGYTRYIDSIDTRIDRVYALRYLSHWRFIEVTANHSFFLGQAASDHLPVF